MRDTIVGGGWVGGWGNPLLAVAWELGFDVPGDSSEAVGLVADWQATSLKRTEESNESQSFKELNTPSKIGMVKLSKLVFAIFVLLTPYLDNYQDNGEHDKERSNSYKHRNQSWTGAQSIQADPILTADSWHQVAGLCEGHSCNRLAGSVGRPDKAANRMLKNQVQMVDRFAECPGLSKQQVWRVRPAVVRKKMRRKLTGAMAMPALWSTDT
uniref:Uncharacterized protein n=1 Tax=Oryza barthii TaxID=65489 RepID=A0A0D3EKV2_9ORYZ